MAVHRGKELTAALNRDEYVNVLVDTSLQQHAEKLGFGLYVVRNALPTSLEESWAGLCSRMFQCKAGEPGGTKLKGAKKGKSHYSTV